MSNAAEPVPAALAGIPVAWISDRYCRLVDAMVPVWDLGFAQGVTVSEQIRTVCGRPWNLSGHLARLAGGLEAASIRMDSSIERLEALIESVACHNGSLLDPECDLSLFVGITAGDSGHQSPSAWSDPVDNSGLLSSRLVVHAAPIAFCRVGEGLANGIALSTVSVRELPLSASPRQLKSRSRMHYRLADMEAQRAAAGSMPLLLGIDGNIADSPTGSLAIVESSGKRIVAVEAGQCLAGTTLEAVAATWGGSGWRLHREKISPARFASAEEILWFSTPFLMLPVTSVDGRPVGTGKPGPVFLALAAILSHAIGLDYLAQARRFGLKQVRAGGERGAAVQGPGTGEDGG